MTGPRGGSAPTSGVPDLLAPAQLGPVRLRNRVLKAATYEGLTHRGRVTTDLRDFHVALAEGGVGMTTVAYCAVSADGRTDRHQFHWQPEALPGMTRLVEQIHAAGAAVSAQIGHSGPVGHPRINRAPSLAPSAVWNTTAGTRAQAVTVDQIDRIVGDFGAATRRARDCGFDAVEVHLGHNYLLSAFLSPRLNRRSDDYGGSLTGRARFPLAVLAAVREAAGDDLAVLAKVSMDDGVRGGFALPEAVEFVALVEAAGLVDAVELTVGSSLKNPMYLFKGDAPIADFAAVMPQPIRLGVRLVGRAVLKEYPYEDGYLLEQGLPVLAATGLPLVALGGMTSRPVMERALAMGYAFVAVGRELLIQPDLVARMTADPDTPSLCTHCNRCMPTNFTGTRCVLVHPQSPRGPSWGQPEGYL